MVKCDGCGRSKGLLDKWYTCHDCSKQLCEFCRIKIVGSDVGSDGEGKLSCCKPCFEARKEQKREKQIAEQAEAEIRYRRHLTEKTHWHPDNTATNCACCDKGFGLMTRRHHCRFCGRVCCSTCCATYEFKDLENKDVRLCERCKDHPPHLSLAQHEMLMKQLTAAKEAVEAAAARRSTAKPPGASGTAATKGTVAVLDMDQLAAFLADRGVHSDITAYLRATQINGAIAVGQRARVVADVKAHVKCPGVHIAHLESVLDLPA